MAVNNDGIMNFFNSIGDSISNFGDNIISGIKDIGNWIGDTFFGGSHGTNQINMEIAEKNLEYQKWANEQNIAFQREENEITRQREDTAVQRAAQDMTAAGLSKTLAAGQPASAAALQAPHTEALNNSYQHQKNVAGMNMLNMVREFYFQKKEDKRADNLNKAQVDQANAQTDYIESQTMGQQLSNDNYLNDLYFKWLLQQSQAGFYNQQTDYYKAQTTIQEIVGKNKQREIDADIDLKVQERLESYSRTQLNYENIQKIANEIYSETIKQEGYKIDNKTKRLAFKQGLRNLIKSKLEIYSMQHDLDFAKEHHLPTGYGGGFLGNIVTTAEDVADNYVMPLLKGGWNVLTSPYRWIYNLFHD